jgi:hypothetical protein
VGVRIIMWLSFWKSGGESLFLLISVPSFHTQSPPSLSSVWRASSAPPPKSTLSPSSSPVAVADLKDPTIPRFRLGHGGYYRSARELSRFEVVD